ncbi:MAG TPA: DUF6776 family protein [Oleiagrimonas sp.]|nr:DUF6776 family protein [Oleiagrimonas sp.]
MPIRPPPRLVVQTEDAPHARRRRRLYVALAWLLSLIVVGVGVYFATDRGPLASPDRAAKQQLQAHNATLKQKVATLTRSLQVSQVATHSLQKTLAERQEKINGLRSDLAFYSHLIGGGAQHHGLRVQNVHLTRVGDSRAWNFTVTLTHNVKRGRKVTGSLRVAVEGIADGKLERLSWKQLSGKAQSDGVDFDFRYFQQVRGTLMLPAGFTPNRLRIQANPAHGKSIVRNVDWSDTLKPVEQDDVQQ